MVLSSHQVQCVTWNLYYIILREKQCESCTYVEPNEKKQMTKREKRLSPAKPLMTNPKTWPWLPTAGTHPHSPNISLKFFFYSLSLKPGLGGGGGAWETMIGTALYDRNPKHTPQAIAIVQRKSSCRPEHPDPCELKPGLTSVQMDRGVTRLPLPPYNAKISTQGGHKLIYITCNVRAGKVPQGACSTSSLPLVGPTTRLLCLNTHRHPEEKEPITLAQGSQLWKLLFPAISLFAANDVFFVRQHTWCSFSLWLTKKPTYSVS